MFNCSFERHDDAALSLKLRVEAKIVSTGEIYLRSMKRYL